MNRKAFVKGTAALGAITGLSIITARGATRRITGCKCTGPLFTDNQVCDEELGFA